jgi:hypothetical protein
VSNKADFVMIMETIGPNGMVIGFHDTDGEIKVSAPILMELRYLRGMAQHLQDKEGYDVYPNVGKLQAWVCVLPSFDSVLARKKDAHDTPLDQVSVMAASALESVYGSPNRPKPTRY